MISTRMPLKELRRLAGKTQVELARSMGIAQPTLSRLEVQADMQISTLRRLVAALGGKLEIVAVVGGEKVALDGSGEEFMREKEPTHGRAWALEKVDRRSRSEREESEREELPAYCL